ncbi:MAG TPA: putative zinc-binding metallopeptidase, partial [Planctomycetota bacterium]|nr:putative zinc-binding metallopeptidase [Planctomycetota bacterium]
LGARVARLRGELARAGLRFRPRVWLSSDWFSPDGVAGFAVPFYLAHPRLQRLEREHLLEVEGGTLEKCLKLLRHETAHALDNAYHLRRRKRFREVFGRGGEPYHASYVPNPRSRKHVLNIGSWYAQSHPLEDFAETFAVWLDPSSRWRKDYAGWPALAKLEYVDALMAEIARQPALPGKSSRPDALPRLRYTLREYFRRKQRHYGLDRGAPDAGMLEELFSADPAYRRQRSAARFVEERRRRVRRRVSRLTGQHSYVVDQVLDELVAVCRERDLRLRQTVGESLLDLVCYVTSRTMKFGSGRIDYQR